MSLISKEWENTIFQKKYNVPAAALVNGIFVLKRPSDDSTFAEILSDHIQKADKKI
jgi:hypothetical protein